MSKQRKFILIASVVGVISMFLPWVDVFLVKVNGMHGSGVFVFLCFLACGFFAFNGDQKTNLNSTYWMLTIILSAIITLIMVINYFDIPSGASGIIGYGFYLAMLSGIAILIFSYIFRTPGATIKGGIDSLKNDMNSKASKP